MDEYVKFDFKEALNWHCEPAVKYMEANYNQPITVEEFIEQYRALPHNHIKHGRHAPGALRRQYYYLKERYGFFKPEGKPNE
jgi:hypothetical protein